MSNERNLDLTRREHITKLLGLVGGAVGFAAIPGCAEGEGSRSEATRSESQALSGAAGILWADCVGSLRALPGCPNNAAILESYYPLFSGTNFPDGGGGVFVWSQSLATDDGGTVLNAGGLGSNTQGWRRVYSGPLNVKWFGATYDSYDGTDDAPAVQRAINAAASKGGGVVYCPPGTMKWLTTVNGHSGIHLLGEAYGSTIVITNSSAQLTVAENGTDRALLNYTRAANFSIGHLYFSAGTDNNVQMTQVYIEDCMYFTLHDLMFGGGGAVQAVTGIHLYANTPQVPPQGLARISNITYSCGDGASGFDGSAGRAIVIDTSGNGNGAQWYDIVFDGYGDLEAGGGINFSASGLNRSVVQGWFMGGGNPNIQLWQGSGKPGVGCTSNLFSAVSLVNASGKNVTIDGSCFDNSFVSPVLSAPSQKATSVVDAGVRTGWISTGGDGAAPLARAWADNGAQVTIHSTDPTIIASVTLTPATTGKLRVSITGTIFNSGGAPFTGAVLGVSVGESATPIYTQGQLDQSAIPSGASATVALCVDLDKLPSAPSVTPGSPITINAVLTPTIANNIDAPAHGLQIEVQEVA